MPRTAARLPIRLTVLAVAAGAALALLPAFATAQITVNTTADAEPSPGECAGAPGDCSLRQAIDVANKAPGPETIVLPAGHYTLTIKGSEENEDASGDLDVTENGQVSIQGAGARTTVVDATGLADRVFEVEPLGSLSLSRLTVTGGLAIGENGGGVFAEEAALALDQVAVRGNTASEEGRGGGVGVDESKTTIANSLIAENHNSGDGGGLWTSQGEISLVNTTLANNVVDTSLYPTAPGWGAYGGAWEINSGTVIAQNLTISGNSIRDGNGGGEGSGTAIDGTPEIGTFVNTIIYGNTGTEVNELAQCDSKLESGGGHNLEQQVPTTEEERCFESPTDLVANPLLGPLGNNGGETDTMALLSGSPAINAGDPGQCPATDQRGLPRPQLGGCDIGAFEVQPSPVPPPVALKPTIKRRGHTKVKKAGKTFLVKTPFRVTCPAGGSSCTGTIKALTSPVKPRGAGTSEKKIFPKRVLIGKAKFSVAPGKTKKLSLKLNRRGAKMLKEAGRLGAKFEVACRAGTGPVVKAVAALKLKLPT